MTNTKSKIGETGKLKPVVYRELPPESQNVRRWHMTDAQRELTGLAAKLRAKGVHVRFENDQLGEQGLRFLRKINAFLRLLDVHVQDVHRFNERSN